MIRQLRSTVILKAPLSSRPRAFIRPFSSSHSSKDPSESTVVNEVDKGGIVSSEEAYSHSSKDSSESKELMAVNEVDKGIISREEAYKQVYDLDFMKATQILLTTPPKRKKFGFDFHLVQFFFVCLPSLAVYLVAQYARYEMRKMEAVTEMDKRGVEDDLTKEMQENNALRAEIDKLKKKNKRLWEINEKKSMSSQPPGSSQSAGPSQPPSSHQAAHLERTKRHRREPDRLVVGFMRPPRKSRKVHIRQDLLFMYKYTR